LRDIELPIGEPAQPIRDLWSTTLNVSRHRAYCVALVVAWFFGLSSNHAYAATRYFDVNGTTTGSGVTAGGSYSWEGNFWNTNDANGTTATTAWTEGDFIRFSAGTDGAGKTYTVTANSNHTFAGMQIVNNGGTVNVNGPGILTLAAGDQGFLVGTPTSQNLNINASLAGPGRISWQGTGSLFLLGNNTFTGGLLFSAGSGVNFNNDHSFGTGALTWGVASQVLAAPTAIVPMNVGNSMVTRAASTLIMATFAQPVTFSGGWTLATGGTSTLDVRNGTVATISGAISGTSTSALTKGGATGTGTLKLSGANTYGGGTNINIGTLELVGPSATLGTGNVTATGAGTSLLFDSGVHGAISDTATLSATNSATMTLSTGVNDAIGNNATVGLSNNAVLNLGAGVNERVGFLSLDNVFQPNTTYGSSQSNAVVKLDFYFSGTGILTVGPSILPGDYNDDGIVNAADYVTWRKNVGQPSQTLPNDTTGVIIGDAQYNLWRSNFGSTTPAPGGGSVVSSTAVPESSSLGLLILGLAALTAIGTCRGNNGFSQDSRRR
jgi:autotransporter-associated beta strand protein